MPVRRTRPVLVALGVTTIALPLAASAAGPWARLTKTPPAVTSERTATFAWTTGHGTRRTLCSLRRRSAARKATRARDRSRGARRFRRCRSPATWSKLRAGRYAFTLIATSSHGTTRVAYRWRIVAGRPGTPPPPPPPGPPPPPPGPPPTPPPGTSCATPPYHYLSPVHPETSAAEQQFVNLVNQARQSLGVRALSLNSSLNLAADSHSYWQDSAYGYSGLSHTGCGGSDPRARFADAGYGGSPAGEVTLVRFPAANAQTAFDMFKSSSGHWALLTSPSFSEIGVGASGYHWTGALGGP